MFHECQMKSKCAGRAEPFTKVIFAVCVTILFFYPCTTEAAWAVPALQTNKTAGAKPGEQTKDNSAQAAAKAGTHHFDRVVIIVLENGDYEAAVKDPNLADLATHGASFSNFHALFHPSYPNYLAMVAGTDFGVHRRGRFLADRQVNFPNDAAHKTIADRLIANGLDFKNYAEELPEGNCPFRIDSQHVSKSKKGDYARKHVPFLSFEEVQEKWCDHVVRVDSGKGNSLLGDDNFFRQGCEGGAGGLFVLLAKYEQRWAQHERATSPQNGCINFLIRLFPRSCEKARSWSLRLMSPTTMPTTGYTRCFLATW